MFHNILKAEYGTGSFFQANLSVNQIVILLPLPLRKILVTTRQDSIFFTCSTTIEFCPSVGPPPINFDLFLVLGIWQ